MRGTADSPTSRDMREYIFICPNSGLSVQGWAAESPLAADYYEAVQCGACNGVHLVNPRSGKVAGRSINASEPEE